LGSKYLSGSGDDGLSTENDGLQSGGADLVDSGGNSGVWEASPKSALSGGVLPQAGENY